VPTFFARYRIAVFVVVGIAALVAIGGVRLYTLRAPASNGSHASIIETQVNKVSHVPASVDPNTINFPRDSWAAASLQLHAVAEGPLAQSVALTGKVALNEDRVAHIFPLVDGRVDEVKIHLGDQVKKGDLLVVVRSTEVGRSMLQLFQNRMERDFAVTKDRWTQTVATNTQAMIKLLRSGASIEEIEKQLTDRPMGDYRDKLMSAYVAHYKANKTMGRLAPLAEGGTISGKQLLEAESELNGTRATLQSLLEQFQQETQQASAQSKQSLKEFETQVAVNEANLKILGFDDKSLATIDPTVLGESISHYPIHSPFDGTIITKDVVLLERVSPERQILSIADLSTVWITTDVYEEHLPLLAHLENRMIKLRSSAWPDKVFEARIFYTGDLVHESSRTVAMRAAADNKEGLLRPGMFVNVEFPSVARTDVLQIPNTAVQEHEGKSFVFVHKGGDTFERRDVSLGLHNSQSAEVTAGLKPGEVIAIGGVFALKSRMLAELLSE
jgi:cobalt-zinc-cadmium efflux system membrane fusion protein